MKGHRAPGPTSGHLVHDLGQPGGCTRPRSQGRPGSEWEYVWGEQQELCRPFCGMVNSSSGV